MRLIFYISGHGFGHASRDIQIVNALARRVPSLRVVLRTTVPEWFLRASLDVPAEIIPGDTDVGVVQPDELRRRIGAHPRAEGQHLGDGLLET